MKPSDRVVVYGSLGLRRGISDLLWAFRKDNRMEEFPAYLDDHPYQVMERIRSERRHGMRTADVVIMPHYAVSGMGFAKELAGYLPKGVESLPANMRSTKQGAVPVGVTFMAMAYDSGVNRKDSLPSGLSELDGAEWKGRLGTQSLTSSKAGNLGAWYLSYLRGKAGDKTWRRFVQSLASENRPVAYDCIDHLLQGLLGGEVGLALTVYSLAYFREKTSGSSVALVADDRIPHMMTFTSAGLVKGSDQNVSATKFMDFLLTPAAQTIIGSIPGIAPSVSGVKAAYDFEHDFGEEFHFHPTLKEFDELKASVDLFRKLGVP